jgi:hypothetical protein
MQLEVPSPAWLHSDLKANKSVEGELTEDIIVLIFFTNEQKKSIWNG